MAKPKEKVAEASMKRSEVVTVRLDPRLKHLADIAARKQRRTLSGYIEWAVEQSLNLVVLTESGPDGIPYTVEAAERFYKLWDVDEAERLAKLAFNFPELLTYEEQLIWRLVRDCGAIWYGDYGGPGETWQWRVRPSSLNWNAYREHWPKFKAVVQSGASLDTLPKWPKTEIPF